MATARWLSNSTPAKNKEYFKVCYTKIFSISSYLNFLFETCPFLWNIILANFIKWKSEGSFSSLKNKVGHSEKTGQDDFKFLQDRHHLPCLAHSQKEEIEPKGFKIRNETGFESGITNFDLKTIPMD